MSDVGYGETPTQDDLDWDQFGKYFTPDKQLELLTAKAEKLVGRTALVGSVLAAGGLVAISTVIADEEIRGWAIAAVALAGTSVLLALATQVRWPSKVYAGDIVSLKKWFNDYVSWRSWVLAAASGLLVLAFAAAAWAASLALRGDHRSPTVGLVTTAVSAADAASSPTLSVSGTVVIPATDPSDRATVRVTAGSDMLVSATQGPGLDGLITISFEAAGIPDDAVVELSVVSERWKCNIPSETSNTALCART